MKIVWVWHDKIQISKLDFQTWFALLFLFLELEQELPWFLQ